MNIEQIYAVDFITNENMKILGVQCEEIRENGRRRRRGEDKQGWMSGDELSGAADTDLPDN